MAVYTKLSDQNLKSFLQKYNLGNLLNYKGIMEGIENTNYLIETDKWVVFPHELMGLTKNEIKEKNINIEL